MIKLIVGGVSGWVDVNLLTNLCVFSFVNGIRESVLIKEIFLLLLLLVKVLMIKLIVGGVGDWVDAPCIVLLLPFSFLNLLHGGHGYSSLGMGNISFTPQLGDSLGLSIELNTLFAIEMMITTERAASTGEGEHGQGYRDGYINTYLTNIDFVDKFAGGGTIGGENGGTVTVGIGIGQLDGFIQSISLKDNQNGAKDFLLIAVHIGGDIGQDGGSYKITILEAGYLNVTAIQDKLGTLFNTRFNQITNTFLGLSRDNGTNISAGNMTSINLQFLGTFN
ncbi:hypothetical protein FF38_10339, partial [Lucilia cuprina]